MTARRISVNAPVRSICERRGPLGLDRVPIKILGDNEEFLLGARTQRHRHQFGGKKMP